MNLEPTRPQRRRRGGRPPATDPRSERVTVRFTLAEHVDLANRAAEAGLELSEFIRRTALGRRVQAPVPPLNREAWLALAPTAANLNQLATHLNRGGVVHGDDLADVLRSLHEDVQALRRALIAVDEPAEAG